MAKIISEIYIAPVEEKDGLVAFANFTIYGAIRCNSVGIMRRVGGGYRLTYPTRKHGDKSVGVFYPINNEIGNLISEEVVNEYEVVASHDRYR